MERDERRLKKIPAFGYLSIFSKNFWKEKGAKIVYIFHIQKLDIMQIRMWFIINVKIRTFVGKK